MFSRAHGDAHGLGTVVVLRECVAITRREVPLDQPAGRRRAHLVLHLHGLDHQQHIAAAHGVTGLDQPLDNLGLQGRANIHHPAIFARHRARW
jgi:hypothetical protein